MPNVTVGEVVQVSLRGRALNQRIIFTHTYQVLTAPTNPTDWSDFADQFRSALVGQPSDFEDAYLACVSSGYQCEIMRIQAVAPSRLAVNDYVINQPGTRGTTNFSNLAAVVTLRTARAGRDQVSNKHIGPIATADATNGQMINAYLTNLNNLGALLELDIEVGETGAVMVPVIWHSRAQGPVPATDRIVSHIAQSSARVMRRRTVGVGE